MPDKIGLGGGCHWCTEAVFQLLCGVEQLQQGWIAALEATSYSEAVLLEFNPDIIPLKVLIEIHLATHSCTSSHSLRHKYRSAIYVFSQEQKKEAETILEDLQKKYPAKIVTQVLLFLKFKLNEENYLDYYRKDPNKPFCRNMISPKLRLLLQEFGDQVDPGKLPQGEVYE
jgi:peptide-methionine (S)-S-oxide reductase